MLHAVNARMASLPGLFKVGHRMPLEDITTSNIFGPLHFVCDDDRRSALGAPVSFI
jgi:hypothetical protein